MRRWAAVFALFAISITAGGGGGGGDDDGGGGGGGGATIFGAVSGQVADRFGAPVPSATVTLQLAGGGQRTVQANASGQFSADAVPVGTTGVQASATEFSPATINVSVAQNQTATANLVLQRSTAPIGGVVSAQLVGGYTTTSAVFALEIFAADSTGAPLANLRDTDFRIGSFTSTSSGTTYTFTRNSITTRSQNSAGPYSAMLLFDQSGSISSTDPSNARLFAAKVFLEGMGTGDNAMISAFASGGSLPYSPVTVYGNAYTSNGSVYYSAIDGLAALEAGGTPLYRSTYLMMDQVRVHGPNTNRAVVVFTDGEDTDGGATIDEIAAYSAQHGVRVFTVGLSNSVNISVLAEMARRGRGAYFQASSATQLIAAYGSLGNLLNGSADVYATVWSVTTDRPVFQSGAWFQTSVEIDTPSGRLFVPFRISF